MDQPLVIRKQRIGETEIEQIQNLIHQYWSQGRSCISREICRLWDWRQENGALKDQVCRLLLRQLEDKGLIELPPRHNDGVLARNQKYYTPPLRAPLFHKENLSGSVGDLAEISLRPARRNHQERLWNYLVHRYHYKGFRIIVGAHVKLIAYAGQTPIACLAFSSSVFRIQPRDRYIGWSKQQRNQNIRYVANNSRFLILPWVRVENLASHLLGLAAGRISEHWEQAYGYPLHLLETFVDRSRFKGTCYQAANWRFVGQTKGHAKKNGQYYHHGKIKDVYVYPLRPEFRQRLCGGAL